MTLKKPSFAPTKPTKTGPLSQNLLSSELLVSMGDWNKQHV